MGLLELSVRVIICAVLAMTVYLSTVPPLMLHSEQQELLNNVNVLTHASINKINSSRLINHCPSTITSLDVSSLIGSYLDASWSERGENFSISVEHKQINTQVGTSYSKPAFVHIQYVFPSVREAQRFYELADAIDGETVSFITAINSNDYSLNSYYNAKNGCSTL